MLQTSAHQSVLPSWRVSCCMVWGSWSLWSLWSPWPFCSVHSLTYHYVTAWFCWQTSPRMNTPWMSLMFSVHVMLILNCQRFRSRTPRLSRDILWQTIWPFRSACLSIFLLKQNCNMAAANSIVKILKVRALQNSEVASWCHAQSCEYFFLPVLNLAWMQRSDTCRELDLTLHPGTSSVTQIYAPVPFRYLNQQVVS